MRIPILSCVLAWTLSGVLAAQAVVHVDSAAGSDLNPGTEALPLRTVAAANGLLGSGATLLFRAGRIYPLHSDGGMPLLLLQPGITVGRYGTGADPVLDGQDMIPAAVVYGASGVTVADVTLLNGPNQTCMFAAGHVSNLTAHRVLFQGGLNGLDAPPPGNPSGSGNHVVACTFIGQSTDGLSIHGNIHFTVVSTVFAYIGPGYASGGQGDACSSHDTATIAAYNCLFYENSRGAMVNINTSGTNYLVNCWVKSTHAPSLVRQDLGGATVVVNSLLHLSGSQLAAAVLTVSGGTIFCDWTTVINDNTNPFSVSFFSTGSLHVFRSTSSTLRGALHAGIFSTGSFSGNFNTYLQAGDRWTGPAGPMNFPAWQTLTGADFNSLGITG